MNLRQELGDQTERSRARRSNNLVPNYNGYVSSVTGFVGFVCHRVCRTPKYPRWKPRGERKVTLWGASRSRRGITGGERFVCPSKAELIIFLLTKPWIPAPSSISCTQHRKSHPVDAGVS